MEREELINEKNELFEKLRDKFEDQAMSNKICVRITCALIVFLLFIEVYDIIGGNPVDIKEEIYYLVLFGGPMVIGFFSMFMTQKIAKTENAEEFLVSYKKYNHTSCWIIAIFFTLLGIAGSYKHDFSRDSVVSNLIILAVIFVISFIIYYFFNLERKDIKRLRELVQETNQN